MPNQKRDRESGPFLFHKTRRGLCVPYHHAVMAIPFITIVSGVPRSGTSMMMRVLEAGGLPPLTDHARAADSDNPNGYYELEAVKRTRSDASWLERAPGHAVKMVHLLLNDLPLDRLYRVIMLRRNIAEVVASQQAMLARRGEAAGPIAPRRLGEIMEAQRRDVLAYLRSKPCFEVFEADYNALLAEPKMNVDALAEFLGLGLDRKAMTGVIDPAMRRQRF